MQTITDIVYGRLFTGSGLSLLPDLGQKKTAAENGAAGETNHFER